MKSPEWRKLDILVKVMRKCLSLRRDGMGSPGKELLRQQKTSPLLNCI